MPNQNVPQNSVNQGGNFPAGNNFSDKHTGYATQVQPGGATSPQPAAQPPQYLNPNNFQQVLGPSQTVPAQQNPNSQPQPINQQAAPLTQNQPLNNPKQALEPQPLPQLDVANHYDHLKQQATVTNKTTSNSNDEQKHDLVKLLLYIIPLLAIFIHVLHPFNDKEVKWHARQSLIAQALWFLVIFVFNLLNIPFFSQILNAIIRIGGYGFMIYAGAQAYNHIRYKIPVVYEIGKGFIDEKL
jgi:uncharacterized membrane protein